jgi:hypothetical protein
MQAHDAINGGAIDAASGSAQLPRNGFKKKRGHLGHWPPTTEKPCPDAGLIFLPILMEEQKDNVQSLLCIAINTNCDLILGQNKVAV